MTTVAEMIVAGARRPRRPHGLGRRRRRAEPGHRRDPPRGSARVDRRAPRGGRRVRRRRAGAARPATLGVCMGTVGPGSIHLLNGLYDAKKSHAPVLAICGQVPLAELGTDFFQEVDNDAVFRDVAVFCRTITSPDAAAAACSSRPIQRRSTRPGVAVLTLPGDVGALRRARRTRRARIARPQMPVVPEPGAVDAGGAADRRARSRSRCWSASARATRASEVLALADRLSAPMVLTLKAKEGLERDNPYAGRPERADRQPGRPARVRRLRPAADARHRLPLHRLVPEGQGGHPDRPRAGPHRPAHRRRPRRRRRCRA